MLNLVKINLEIKCGLLFLVIRIGLHNVIQGTSLSVISDSLKWSSNVATYALSISNKSKNWVTSIISEKNKWVNIKSDQTKNLFAFNWLKYVIFVIDTIY